MKNILSLLNLLDISRYGCAGRVDLGINSRSHKDCTGGSACNEVEPHGRPSKSFLERTNGQKSNRGGQRSASVDKTSDGSQRLAASTNRRVGSQIGSDGRCNNVVGSSDKNSHASKHEKKDGRVHVSGFRELGKDGQEDNQKSHEDSNDESTATSEKVRNVSNDDTSGHHSNGIKRGDEVGGDGIEILSQEVRKPEEQAIIDELEKTKGKGIVGHHRNLEGTDKRNCLGSLVFFDGFSLFGHFLFLGLEFRLTNLDFGSDDSHFVGIGNEFDGDKGKKNVANSRE